MMGIWVTAAMARDAVFVPEADLVVEWLLLVCDVVEGSISSCER